MSAGGPQRAPLSETRRCAQAWTAGEDALEHLAVLYAIEASQPEIAKTKLEGLVERYGYGSDEPLSPTGGVPRFVRASAHLQLDELLNVSFSPV
jgi:hypothetical protein